MKNRLSLILALLLSLTEVLPVSANTSPVEEEGIVVEETKFKDFLEQIDYVVRMNLINYKKINFPVINPDKNYIMFFKDGGILGMRGKDIIYLLVRKFYPNKMLYKPEDGIMHIIPPLLPGEYLYDEMPIYVAEDLPGKADDKAISDMLHKKRAFITYQLYDEAEKEVLAELNKTKPAQNKITQTKTKTKKTITKKITNKINQKKKKI